MEKAKKTKVLPKKTVKAKKPVSKKPAVKKVAEEVKLKAEKIAGIEIDLFNKEGKAVGKISLPRAIFALKANAALLAQAVRVYLANQRRGTASVKTRGQVTGSTRKIYRQKGTGRARHGDIKAPIFVGGGIAFGPKPRDFSLALSKKMKRKALFQALSLKRESNNLIVVDSLASLSKTKEILQVFTKLKALATKRQDNSLLLILPQRLENIVRAARNIKGVIVTTVHSLDTYNIMKNKKLVFLKDSLAELVKIFKV